MISQVKGAEIVTLGPYEMPQAEQKELAGKAKAGDGHAAYQLYNGLTIDHDERAAEAAAQWLLLAVKLKDPDADRILAMRIQSQPDDYRKFGATRRESIEALLKQSAKTDGLACFDLADAYEKGVYDGGDFGPKDLVQAREYYLRGAELNDEFCFFSLAHLCHEGLGGPRDDRAAYYWVSLDANCVDAGSVSGGEIWTLRRKVAANLPLSAMREEWVKIDDFVNKMHGSDSLVYPPPFAYGTNEAESIKKGRSAATSRELEHRHAMEERG